MDLIIKNGLIFNDDSSVCADIAVNDGKIVCIGQGLDYDAKRIVDAKGLFVLPGGVEPHAHFSVPFFGTVSCDDYSSGTCAAAHGGVTCVIDFATQEKGHGLMEMVESRKAMADGETFVDYSFHMIMTDANPQALAEIPMLVDAGIPSIKVYMVYKKEGLMMDDADMFRILRITRDCGGLMSVHAENPDIIDLLTDEFMSEGKTDALHHFLSRPEFVSAEATKRVLHWATTLNAPLYVVHVSDKESMSAIQAAQQAGHEIYAETCPQYLNFTSDVYTRHDAKRFVCSPPMKGAESQAALWDAVKTGAVSTIGSDHCPFMAAEKDAEVAFPMTPNGMMGIETRYSYMLSEALKGRLSISRAVKLCAAAPAKIFGCRSKGTLEIGKDADIVLFDPNARHVLTAADNHSKVDHSIWDGYDAYGKIIATFCRGELIVENGKVVGTPGYGKFIKRQR